MIHATFYRRRSIEIPTTPYLIRAGRTSFPLVHRTFLNFVLSGHLPASTIFPQNRRAKVMFAAEMRYTTRQDWGYVRSTELLRVSPRFLLKYTLRPPSLVIAFEAFRPLHASQGRPGRFLAHYLLFSCSIHMIPIILAVECGFNI
jgi:hypothetical protein